MHKAIIFDCNGVFEENSLQENMDIFSEEFVLDKEKLLPEYLKLEHQAVIGAKTSLEVCQELIDIFNIDATAEEVRKVWVDTYIGIPNTEVHEYAKELSRKYKMYIFSNHSDLFFDVIKTVGLDKLFKAENLFISSQIGLLKPTKESFDYVLNRINLRPEEIIFIDDQEPNVFKARDLGMSAILFKNANQLKSDIKSLET
jgi:putative hydrolase of the HAD superfamily